MNDIRYEDDAIIVLHKPAGVPVQTSRIGQKDLVSILKNYRSLNGEPTYIGIVHRLDQPVEGLLAVAKTPEAAADLGSQWNAHSAGKYYRAIVHNCTKAPLTTGSKGTLTDYLLRDGRTNCSKVVKNSTKGAKKAVLHYEVLQADAAFADLLIQLETGRHHQIRVQMANAGVPLLGDRKYGRDASVVLESASCFTEDVRKVSAVPNLALCSVRLELIHPKSRQKMEFETTPKNPAFQLLHGIDTA